MPTCRLHLKQTRQSILRILSPICCVRYQKNANYGPKNQMTQQQKHGLPLIPRKKSSIPPLTPKTTP